MEMKARTFVELNREIAAEVEAEREKVGQAVWEEITEWFAVCRKFEVEDAGGECLEGGE
jgi:hypothetical protein